MSDHNDDSFRDKNMKQKVGTIVGVTLFIAVILGFIIGIYLFGMAGIFELLGVQYTSVWSLIIFVVSFFILASIVELFSKPISNLITGKITGKFETLFIQFSIQSLSNLLCLFIVDVFMGSITLTLKSGFIVAILLTLLEMTFEDKENKSES
ncbi:YrvL family regulatory protein [Oceanobacillus sp. Castelsardo]|uniref:YrvL family regulatory protein n=1 Tax=Oceanobacillus sp. Castelsardo TaxID=1851204 RepID=UPI0008398760|nr:YrvL family regulatory protein [Oceanobacillus sp. Castelsardo]